jgi:hypothetical protein
LNNLNGKIEFAVVLESNNWKQRWFESQIDVLVNIQDGVINFSDVEDHAFGFGDMVVDFEIDEDSTPAKLYVELDATINERLIEWDLTPEEQTLAGNDKVRLTTLLNPKKVDNPPDPDAEPFKINSLHYKDADIDLYMPNSSKIALGNAGTIELGGNFESTKALRLWSQHKGFFDSGPGLPLNLEAHVRRTDLLISGGDKRLQTGQIHIDGLKDAHLDFKNREVSPGINVDVPSTLEGTLTHASAENIRITPIKKPKGKKK